VVPRARRWPGYTIYGTVTAEGEPACAIIGRHGRHRTVPDTSVFVKALIYSPTLVSKALADFDKLELKLETDDKLIYKTG
jgi:hypothetical protein